MSRAVRTPEVPWLINQHADREWMKDAACRGKDTEMWFPQPHHSRAARDRTKRNTRTAQLICQSCPVQPECLHHALATDTRYGIWGGATEDDRAVLSGKRVFG